MRLLLITDAWFPQVNGVVRTLSMVCDELRAMEHEVQVLHPGLFKTFPLPRYSEIRLPWFPGPRVRRVIRDYRPDAIHIATEGTLGFTARRFCCRKRIPFTTSYHTKYPQYLQRYILLPESIGYGLMRWFHKPAAATLVPTPSVKRELDEQGFTNVVTWTRGVDVDLFHPATKNTWDLPRPIFVYFGRVAREKNIEDFLDADLPGSKVIIGSGPMLKSLKRKYPEVHFAGYQFGEELARSVASADVFVFPSRTDTFGVVMLEAMACGVPVAAYPVTGPNDVVEHGVSGFLHEDIAVAATEALKLDPQQCRAHALQFTWRRCAEIMLDALAPIDWGRTSVRIRS